MNLWGARWCTRVHARMVISDHPDVAIVGTRVPRVTAKRKAACASTGAAAAVGRNHVADYFFGVASVRPSRTAYSAACVRLAS